MSTSLRWILRLLAALAVLLALAVATSPWTVPAWLRREIPRVGQQQLGRTTSVGAVAFNPLLLRLRLDDLRVLDAAGHGDALRLQSGVFRMDWSSLWGLHPRIGLVRLQGLQLHVVRDARGNLDFDDIVQRLRRRPATASSGPPRFSLEDFELRDASLGYDDLGNGVRARLAHLQLHLTHLSTLAAAHGALDAQASGLLDGAPVRLRLGGTLLGAHPVLRADLQLQGLALAPWSALQPADLPVRLHAGSLSTKLQLLWALNDRAGPDLSGQVQLRDLRWLHAGQPLLQVREADVPLASVRPLRHDVRLGVLQLAGVRAEVDRAQWSGPHSKAPADPPAAPAATASKPAAAPASSAPASSTAAASTPAAAATPPVPWQFQVAGLRMQDAGVHWHDAAARPVVDWDFTIPELQFGAAQWPLRDDVHAQARVLGPKGLQLQADATLGSAQDTLRLQLQGLDPQLARPYAAPWLDGRPLPGGSLQARVDLQWKASALRVDLPEAQWQDFSWQPTGAGHGDGPRAKAIRLRRASALWSPGARGLRIDAAELDVEQPATGPGAGVRAQAVQLRDAGVDLAARRVRVGTLSVLRPQASLARDSSGRWSVGQLLPAGLLPPAGPAGRGAPASAPWSVQLADATVRQGSVYLADTYPAHPVVLAVTGVDAELRGAAWPMRAAADFSLQAHVRDARQAPREQAGAAPTGGSLNLRGTLRAAPWRMQATLRASNLPAQVAGDYLPRLNARLLRASADAQGRVELRLGPRGPVIGFDGSAAVDDLAANTVQPDASLLGWQSLLLRDMKLRVDPQARPATQLDIGHIELHRFNARLSLSPQARLNVTEVLRPASPAGARATASAPATSAAATTPKASGGPALRLRVGGITLDHGRVNWTDHFVQPNYSASLSDVQGHIGRFASDSPAQADVDLRAVAEGTAPVTLSGRVNPLLSPPQLDLRARVDDLQLAPLTPYARRYAGYGIERGLLSMNVHYDIDTAGKLQADNQLVLRQLTFGPHVPSPTATKLPVLLAVDLLKDPDGTIHLDIPISGSLNDPEFSLGAVIAKAVGKLLLRAVTAPFSLMAHMFEGGKPPPQLNVVPFAPGSARAPADDATRLQDIARLLKAKPQLVVTITGRACGATETDAYRQAVLERQLLARWRSDLPRAEAYAHAKDTKVPADARDQALAELYRDTALPDKPRNVLGLARRVPPATMQQLLLRGIAAGPEHLQALAMRRAVALRDALAKLGVPAVRQFISAPEVLGADAKDCSPSASLSVSLP